MTTLAFLSPSGPEWLILAVFALIVLGPQRLPDAARSLGRGLAEMRASFAEATDFDSDHEPDPDEAELPDYPEDEGDDVKAAPHDDVKTAADTAASAPKLPEAR